jgi:hypothetical protein
LDTVHLTYTPIMSRGYSIIALEKLTLTLSIDNVLNPVPITVELGVASLVLTSVSMGFYSPLGCETSNVLAALRQHGWARTTPPRFVSCDLMSVIDDIRVGAVHTGMTHDDDCLSSDLLNALITDGPVPWLVPTDVGTWLGSDGDSPHVEPPTGGKFLMTIYNSGAVYLDAAEFYLSNDYGFTWFKSPYPTINCNGVEHTGAASVVIKYIGNGYILLSAGQSNGICYLAERYGQIWYKLTISGMNEPVNSISADGHGIVLASNDNTSWSTTTPAYLARSTNYGRSWDVQTFPTMMSLPHHIFIDSDMVLMIKYGLNAKCIISKSLDGGITWVDKYTWAKYYGNCKLAHMGSGIVICSDVGVYGDYGSLLRSTDYGETWTRVYDASLVGYGIYATNLGNGRALLVGSYSGAARLYYTADYGINWELCIPTTMYNDGGKRPISFGYGVAVAFRYGYGGHYYANVTFDYGNSWTEAPGYTTSPCEIELIG